MTSVVVDGNRDSVLGGIRAVAWFVIVWSVGHVGLTREIDFNTQIRPLLAQHCLHCHGPDEANREAEFRVDTRRDATSDLGGHAGIVPGQPDQSEVLRRITTEDLGERMPPPDDADGLKPAEVSLLRQWIAEGAHYETHWAFSPIRRSQVPAAPIASDRARDDATDIDRFIIAKLDEQGLHLSPPVDKPALIRRATLDLIGLPPTWEEVQAFVNDVSPDAFSRVIQRLLDSPRYGERWGRHWLDIARYADTHGGGAIGFKRFPFSYTYRDYVIDVFNRDVPYDRFVLEQLAADQLDLDENHPSLAALGFLTVGRQYSNPHDLIDDRIDVISRGLMGLTVTCARCHDHKYDPIPATDYYSLYATLATSYAPDDLPLVGQPQESEDYGSYKRELAVRQKRHDEMAREHNEVLRHRLRMQVGLYLQELAKGTPEQDLSNDILSYRTDDVRPLMLERWRQYLDTLTVDDPVFGVWHQLARLDAAGFEATSQATLAAMIEENGDVSALSLSKLATEPPRWNPRLLEVIKERGPKSMVDVAEVYGALFATVQEEWLRELVKASLEAVPGAQVVPDEDAAHTSINSSVDRQLRFHLYGPGTPIALSDEDAAKLLNRPIHDHVAGLKGAIHDLHLTSPGSPPRAMVLRERADDTPFFVLRRGNPIDRGALVHPRILTAIGDRLPDPFVNGQRRLGLAHAIVDPANPLTRRIVVNWVWQRHFGVGLVRTPDDVGTRGDLPTHPELLDYLAECFLDDGWSIKQLHRRIMLSRVYQQAAVEDNAARLCDPQNRLLWRMPRHRLELEAMRDSLLSVAGRLDTTMGGRPFDLSAEPFTPRRSVYGFVNRDVIAGFFSTFDMADPSVCVARRPVTTVPQQTLYALNSKFIQEQARHLAELPEVRTADSDELRVQRMFQRAYSRMPTEVEQEMALDYIQSQYGQSDADKASTSSWQRLAHVLLAANEFVFVD